MALVNILLVDDEKDLLNGLKRKIQRAMGDEVAVITAASGEEALAVHAEGKFPIAVVDIKMPGMDGMDLLARLRQRDPDMTVVIMTAYATIETAVEAIRQGAYDFITKPFDTGTLLRTIRKALERHSLIAENKSLRMQVSEADGLGDFIGVSERMKKFLETLRTIAATDYTVLVRGGSGTGKELAARALHRLSRRKSKRLIPVNCPAIPESLLESELFGHKRGAFTGADRDKAGLLVEANGGTVVLDEIGDIPVSVQVKLLRLLQEHEVSPIGSNQWLKVDVRIIASTNQNLEEKITAGSFRTDFFHRLNMITLWTPSLDELRDDIPVLADHFVRKFCTELSLPLKQLSPDAVASLQKKSWPGNVRELQNVLRKAVLFSGSDRIETMDLQFDDPVRAGRPALVSGIGPGSVPGLYRDAKEQVLRDFTEDYVSKLLRETEGNVTKAAEISGLTRAALQKIMKRLAIQSEQYR